MMSGWPIADVTKVYDLGEEEFCIPKQQEDELREQERAREAAYSWHRGSDITSCITALTPIQVPCLD